MIRIINHAHDLIFTAPFTTVATFGVAESKKLFETTRLVATGNKSTNYAKLRMSQEDYLKVLPFISKIIIYTQKGEGIGSGIHYTAAREFVDKPNITDIVAIVSGDSDGAGWRYWYVIQFKNGDSYTSGHWGRWYDSSDGWY